MTMLAEPNPCSEERIADALRRDEPALVSSLDFGPFVRQGSGDGPALLIGDQSEISLLGLAPASPLEYRMALLARPGDHVLLHRRAPAFESYLRDQLGLTDVTFHQVSEAGRGPLTRQAWTSPAWVNHFAAVTADHGGLTIKSYLTTGNTWRLAKAIGEQAAQIVHVGGPSPRMTRRANDKLWFARLARRVIGETATPPTLAAYGPAATAGLVRRIGRLADQVIVKVPDSAGSAGNLRLDSAAVRGRTLSALRTLLMGRLHAVGWRDSYPLLVGVWDRDVICSPSVQMWLPCLSDGAPRIDGIFEQHVRDDVATFVGATRSTLPQKIQDQLHHQATRIARVLQRLGYFGRCSLDAVVCQSSGEPPAIHWIECNGRWGGVSIPMTAAAQIVPNTNTDAISIVQELLPARWLDTTALLQQLQGLLFHAGKSKAGLIIGSPPAHPEGPLINLLGVAPTQARADALMGEAMRRLAKAGPR